MGPQEDYIKMVLTCKGDYYDPNFHVHLEDFNMRLQHLIVTDKRQLVMTKVEPWNSVRVTFNIPKEAAVRLKYLAEQGNLALRELGVLAVQIEGDRHISLTIAGKDNETTQLVFQTSDQPTAPTPEISQYLQEQGANGILNAVFPQQGGAAGFTGDVSQAVELAKAPTRLAMIRGMSCPPRPVCPPAVLRLGAVSPKFPTPPPSVTNSPGGAGRTALPFPHGAMVAGVPLTVGSSQRMFVANKGITSSSPLLVNLLQTDAAGHFNTLQQQQLQQLHQLQLQAQQHQQQQQQQQQQVPPPFHGKPRSLQPGAAPAKRKRRSKKWKDSQTTAKSAEVMDEDIANQLSSIFSAMQQRVGSMPATQTRKPPNGPRSQAETSATVSRKDSLPDATQQMVNPYTGQLEPVEADTEDGSSVGAALGQLQPQPNPLVALHTRLLSYPPGDGSHPMKHPAGGRHPDQAYRQALTPVSYPPRLMRRPNGPQPFPPHPAAFPPTSVPLLPDGSPWSQGFMPQRMLGPASVPYATWQARHQGPPLQQQQAPWLQPISNQPVLPSAMPFPSNDVMMRPPASHTMASRLEGVPSSNPQHAPHTLHPGLMNAAHNCSDFIPNRTIDDATAHTVQNGANMMHPCLAQALSIGGIVASVPSTDVSTRLSPVTTTTSSQPDQVASPSPDALRVTAPTMDHLAVTSHDSGISITDADDTRAAGANQSKDSSAAYHSDPTAAISGRCLTNGPVMVAYHSDSTDNGHKVSPPHAASSDPALRNSPVDASRKLASHGKTPVDNVITVGFAMTKTTHITPSIHDKLALDSPADTARRKACIDRPIVDGYLAAQQVALVNGRQHSCSPLPCGGSTMDVLHNHIELNQNDIVEKKLSATPRPLIAINQPVIDIVEKKLSAAPRPLIAINQPVGSNVHTICENGLSPAVSLDCGATSCVTWVVGGRGGLRPAGMAILGHQNDLDVSADHQDIAPPTMNALGAHKHCVVASTRTEAQTGRSQSLDSLSSSSHDEATALQMLATTCSRTAVTPTQATSTATTVKSAELMSNGDGTALMLKNHVDTIPAGVSSPSSTPKAGISVAVTSSPVMTPFPLVSAFKASIASRHPITAPCFPLNLTESVQKVVKAIPCAYTSASQSRQLVTPPVRHRPAALLSTRTPPERARPLSAEPLGEIKSVVIESTPREEALHRSHSVQDRSTLRSTVNVLLSDTSALQGRAIKLEASRCNDVRLVKVEAESTDVKSFRHIEADRVEDTDKGLPVPAIESAPINDLPVDAPPSAVGDSCTPQSSQLEALKPAGSLTLGEETPEAVEVTPRTATLGERQTMDSLEVELMTEHTLVSASPQAELVVSEEAVNEDGVETRDSAAELPQAKSVSVEASGDVSEPTGQQRAATRVSTRSSTRRRQPTEAPPDADPTNCHQRPAKGSRPGKRKLASDAAESGEKLARMNDEGGLTDETASVHSEQCENDTGDETPPLTRCRRGTGVYIGGRDAEVGVNCEKGHEWQKGDGGSRREGVHLRPGRLDMEPDGADSPAVKRATRSSRAKDHCELPASVMKRRRASKETR